ncbi:hypothetical protein JAO29_14390 [Edaphobacter sp. HDX4]|uniref:hypothetical protein n=1 Tax=Edaphobacter sp. HDX4 TaxID=2794064 RepID=UPI002FE5A5E6
MNLYEFLVPAVFEWKVIYARLGEEPSVRKGPKMLDMLAIVLLLLLFAAALLYLGGCERLKGKRP